jgi:hypothetical protein
VGMSRFMKRILKRDLRRQPGGVKAWRLRMREAGRLAHEHCPGTGGAYKTLANDVQ